MKNHRPNILKIFVAVAIASGEVATISPGKIPEAISLAKKKNDSPIIRLVVTPNRTTKLMDDFIFLYSALTLNSGIYVVKAGASPKSLKTVKKEINANIP
jgi:hypothetical protein